MNLGLSTVRRTQLHIQQLDWTGAPLAFWNRCLPKHRVKCLRFLIILTSGVAKELGWPTKKEALGQ